MKRICKRCGGEFQPPRKDRFFCDECLKVIKSESVVRQRTCQTCGKAFPGGPRAFYCPDCRAERKKASNAAYHRKGGAERPLGSTDICTRCGKEYTVNSGKQRYCPDCAEIAIKEKIMPKKAEYTAAYRAAHPEQRAELLANSRRAECPICGRMFAPYRLQKYCSTECSKEAEERSRAEYALRTGKRKTPRAPKIPKHEKGEEK